MVNKDVKNKDLNVRVKSEYVEALFLVSIVLCGALSTESVFFTFVGFFICLVYGDRFGFKLLKIKKKV